MRKSECAFVHVNSDYPYGVTFTLASDIKFVVKTEGVILIEYIWDTVNEWSKKRIRNVACRLSLVCSF